MQTINTINVGGIDKEIEDTVARNGMTSESSRLDARIDNIIAPAGGAPSAEEVQDARIGYDNTIYQSLGLAIRTQIGDLPSSRTVSEDGNLNDLIEPGWYRLVYSSEYRNSPPGALSSNTVRYIFVYNDSGSSNMILQKYLQYEYEYSYKEYVRLCSGGVWGEWTDTTKYFDLYTSISMDNNGNKIPTELVFTSTTDNHLDTNNVIYGIGIDTSTWKFVYHKNARLSRLIPLKGATKVTVSYPTLPTDMRLAIAFLKDNNISDSSVTEMFGLRTDTSRTVDVPAGSIFAVVSLREATTSAVRSSFDYRSMKVSLSDQVATQSYKPVLYGFAHLYEHLGEELSFNALNDDSLIISSKTNNILNITDVIMGYRGTDISPYFVKVDDCVMSKPIYVKDKGFITVRSSSVSVNNRWAIFTDRPIMDEAYVIGVSNQFGVNPYGVLATFHITVPSEAVWMYLTLKAPGGDDNWVSDTAAYGAEATQDEYEEGDLIGIVKYNNGHACMIETGSDSGITEAVKEHEKARTLADFVPYSVGINNQNVSYQGQYDCCNLLFFTDSHVDTEASLENMRDVIDFANTAPIQLDAIVNAGDVINPYGETKETARQMFESMFANIAKKSNIPVIYAKGNHELNDWSNPPSKAFTDSDWSSMWFDYAESKYGIVRQTKSSGQKSTWHYYDIPDHKIRIIAVDVQDTDKTVTDANGKVKYFGSNSFYISNEQMNWIANVALNFDNKSQKDWGVICVLHQYIDKNDVPYSTTLSPAYESAITKLDLLCKAFNQQGTYSNSYTFSEDSFYNLSINADFTRYANLSAKPYMICWLLGHEHFDRVETINGFPKIWTLNGSASTAYSDNRVARVVGTSTQNCFDLIAIDTKTRKIRIVRYGAGKTCYGNGGNRYLPDGLSY